MWQFDILNSDYIAPKSPQYYLNMKALEESRKLNGRNHAQRVFFGLLRRIVRHKT